VTSSKRSAYHKKWGWCVQDEVPRFNKSAHRGNIYLFTTARVTAGLNSIYLPSPKNGEETIKKKKKKLPSRSQEDDVMLLLPWSPCETPPKWAHFSHTLLQSQPPHEPCEACTDLCEQSLVHHPGSSGTCPHQKRRPCEGPSSRHHRLPCGC